MATILIVEDEPRILEFLQRGLRAAGYATSTATDGKQALDIATTATPDLIVLDLTLPQLDGLEVLRQLRGQGSRIPVLVLTARSGADNAIIGLDAGADDYLDKPFRFDELLARVRARLRSDTTTQDAPTELNAGGVHLDLLTRRAQRGDRTSDLSAREFTMLETFLRQAGEVLSREQLLAQVWRLDHDPGSNVVDVYVRNLRRKLGHDVITTVRGMGYRLDN